MRKKLKQSIAMVLAFVMLVTMLPCSAVSAAAVTGETEAATEITTEAVGQTEESGTLEFGTLDVTEETGQTEAETESPNEREEKTTESVTEDADKKLKKEADGFLDDSISEMTSVGDTISMDTVVADYASAKIVYKLPATNVFSKINAKGKGIKKYGKCKTEYSKMKCAEYVYRCLTDAGVLKSASNVKTECNDLYSYMLNNGWELVIKPEITKANASKKTVLTNSNWKDAVAKAVSDKAHASVMNYVKKGKIKAGDVMFFVKEGSTKDSKYGHVAIVTRDVVTAANGHGDTLVISHATSDSNGYFSGKNGSGYLNDSLRNTTWTWEKSAEENASFVDYISESELEDYLAENGGAGVGFAVVRKEEPEKYTYLQVYKQSFSKNLTQNNSYYNTNGIEYIVSVNNSVVDSVTLEEMDEATGYAQSDVLKIDMGTAESVSVTITEDANTLENTGFLHNNRIYTATLTECKKADAYKIGVDLCAGEVGDQAAPGAVYLHKVSAGGFHNDMYSLQGARYKLVNFFGQNVIYYPSASDATNGTNGTTAEFTTDANGNTPMLYVPYGTYYFQETAPSKGHLKHSCGLSHAVTVTADSPSAEATCVEPIMVDPINVDIKKININDGAKNPQILPGAVFALKFYEGNYAKGNVQGTPRVYYFASYIDADGDVWPANLTDPNSINAAKQLGYSSAELYTGNNGTGLPQGTFTIEEVKAPAGMELNEQKIIVNGKELNDRIIYGQVLRTSDVNGVLKRYIEGVEIADSAGNFQIIVKNEEQRADLRFTKVDYETKEPLEGVAFRITDKTTGESHIVVTDADGVADTSASYASHLKNTNGYDHQYQEDKELKAKECGIWFAGAADAKPSDDKGALLVTHTYEIEELVCPANKGKKRLIIPVSRTISEEDSALTVDLGKFTNVGKIELGSLAICEETGSHVAYPVDVIHIQDEVSYKFLTAGETYTLKGIIMEIQEEQGKKTIIPAKDAQGNYIRANRTFQVEERYEETKQEKTGKELVSFTFDGTNAENKTYVLYEYLFAGTSEELIPVKTDGEGNFVEIDETGVILDSAGGEPAKHTDMNDENQRFSFPSIDTQAWADDTQAGVVLATEETKVTDTVSYESVLPDHTYTLYAKVMYMPEKTEEDTAISEEEEPAKETEPVVLTDKAGKAVEIIKSFQTGAANGSVDVELPVFDATQLSGKKIVIYERLYDGELTTVEELEHLQTIASHESFGDEDQTVYFPDLATKAVDSDTLDKNSLADKEVTIQDTVHYTGLLPNKEYTVSGVLMDKDTGASVVDASTGQEVRASVTFTPDEPEGEVEVTFRFDGSALAGKTIVAFEYLYYNNKRIGLHEEIHDTEQTIFVPELKTSLRDAELGTKNTFLDGEVTLIDTVSYQNLIEGYQYKVSGYLMDKDTNEPILINNQKITAETTFIAKADKGIVIAPSQDTKEPVEKTDKAVSGTVDVTYQFDGTSLMKEDGTPTVIVCFETLVVAQDYAEQGHYEEVITEAYEEKTYETRLLCDQCGEDLTDLPAEELQKHVTEHGSYTETLVEGESIHHDAVTEQQYVKDVDAVTKDVVIAVHEDIHDIDQTVTAARGRTSAKGQKSQTNVVLPEEKVVIVDTVFYSGLEVNKTYTVKGTLYKKPEKADQNTVPEALLVDGKPVTSETTFVPDTPNGAVDVTFTINASELQGESVVVFEDCLYENKSVFTHADITDDNQTIHFPKIGTKAADQNGNKKISDSDVVLVDTISYSNLKTGIPYIAYGTIMDEQTGKPVKVNGKEVKAKTKFTPKKADGTVEVKFAFSAKGLEGHKLVVFEDVRVASSDVSIGKHEDLTDKDQTVTISDTLNPPKTGQLPFLFLLAVVILGAGIYAGTLAIRKRRKDNV